ncbi:MAG: bifunctional DNA-formamidopyrimidine glycosylase/DNA-(apurinic or apyrimidinic site) lyase [bacterium]|nr:bifunctional DNA-formamidopyrimidine glycosylase/DNA-(apurinic or apyrimidinic site) lyase [bacterium]
MPELPEVEHVTNALRGVVLGRTIEKASLIRQRLAPDIEPAAFSEKLAGAAIRSITRRGKHILLEHDNGNTLIVHLRMSGRFYLLTPDDEDPKFSHAIFYLTDGSRLVFQDQRHFGLMKIVKTKDLHSTKELSKLAPEPFTDEFSVEYLASVLARSNKPIKEFLLDQTKVCGVGNIYASETLFLSKISPRRKAKGIKGKAIAELHKNIPIILNEAIALTKTIIPDPVIIGEGVYGAGSLMRWRVYDREGKECPECSSPIKRIRQGARSTYYCAKCQR